MTPEEVIIKTQAILKENSKDWQERYVNYLTKSVENIPSIVEKRRLFHKWGNLNVYFTIGRAKDNSSDFDLRYQGQSVGSVNVSKEGKVTLHISEEQYKNNCNEKYFIGYPKSICLPSGKEGYDWKKSVEAKEFRKYFKSHPEKQGHQEHKYENQLLVEFYKNHSDKSLCGIQPVTIGDSDLFFQLTTPLTASTSEIKYAPKKGGGIDILARRNRVLTVFELKDEFKTKGENPEKVICQAISYATFIVELCGTKARDKFWEFCRYSGEKHGNEKINVSILMPDPGDGTVPEFMQRERVLTVPGSKMKLELHYTYYDKENATITRTSL